MGQDKELVMNRPSSWCEFRKRSSAARHGSVWRDTENFYELIECADFAMYEAKKSGKNSFSEFDPERYRKAKASKR